MNKSGVYQKNDMQIHYDLLGEGSPLLCISGFGCSNYNFEYLKAELSKSYQLVLIDNRGMGKSSPVSSEYLIDDLALDAIEVMKSLGHEEFAVMGISMGGFIAQKVALLASDSVKTLVLACTTSSGDDFPKLAKLDEESIRRSFSLDARTYNLLVTKATVHPSVEETRPELFDSILNLRIMNQPKVDQVLLQQKAVDKFLDETIDLSQIKCPTLVITGAQDRFVNPDCSKVLEEKIPNSTLKMIDESDHHFFLEKPEETVQVVSNYLGKQL